MHTPETIIALVDAHAKDMLRRFSGTNCDPDKSRAAVLEALRDALEMKVLESRIVVHPPIPATPLAKIPRVLGRKP